MQRRRILWVLLTALLYFALSGIATRPAQAQGWQWPPTQKQQPSREPAQQPAQPTQQPAEEPAQQPSQQPGQEPAQESGTETIQRILIEERPLATPPHVGVILPLQSSAYARLAEQVRLGILTASRMASYNALPVKVYSTAGEPKQILEAYERATREGARAIIGPLTRDGVSAVAERALVSVPTVALNVPAAGLALPSQMYVFGLQIETEAEQVARLAFTRGGRKALVIVGEDALGQRIAQAFARQWRKLKGDIVDEFKYSTDAAELTRLRALVDTTAADVVFLALNAPRARFIRTYLGTELPIYATSLVYASTNRLELYDLNGVRFMDMPWLLQPDHPAVMTYLRAPLDSGALDEERFYALGIDAYRISQALLENSTASAPIDGVTGTIKLDEKHYFTHELTPAYFSYGRAHQLPDEAGGDR
ncbi:MAG: penicillin-binding protein activator [Burkholderiales bacterium]|jgi:outer membrane PBP1 activator LpoA protein